MNEARVRNGGQVDIVRLQPLPKDADLSVMGRVDDHLGMWLLIELLLCGVLSWVLDLGARRTLHNFTASSKWAPPPERAFVFDLSHCWLGLLLRAGVYYGLHDVYRVLHDLSRPDSLGFLRISQGLRE